MTETKKTRPRAFVTFDQLTFDLLERASDETGLAVSFIVNQLLRAHVQELSEYTQWLKRQTGDIRARGVHALNPYGPNDLITEMQRIDATYKAPDARQFVAGASAGGDAFTADELAELRALLAERRTAQ